MKLEKSATPWHWKLNPSRDLHLCFLGAAINIYNWSNKKRSFPQVKMKSQLLHCAMERNQDHIMEWYLAVITSLAVKQRPEEVGCRWNPGDGGMREERC